MHANFVQQQKDRGMNPYDHPRTARVMEMVKIHRRELDESTGGQVGLRKKNTLLHVYTHDQLISIQDHLMKRGGITDLRLRLDILMGHFMLLRSDNRLQAELADLFMIPQAREGVRGDVPMLFLLLRHSKVNSCLTAKDIEFRRKLWERWSIVTYFVIKMFESVRQVPWHFIYSFDSRSPVKPGLISLTSDGRKSSSSVAEPTPKRSCHTPLKISPSRPPSSIMISSSRVGRILEGRVSVG